MTEDMEIELLAINCWNQEQAKLRDEDPAAKRQCWHQLTKKERNKWRKIATDLLSE